MITSPAFSRLSNRPKQRTLLASMTLLGLLAAAAPSVLWAQAAGEASPEEQERAREVLRQKESDPSKEENLEQILNKTQQDYSLVKQGWWDIFLNIDYTYFGDARSQDALIIEQTRNGRNQQPTFQVVDFRPIDVVQDAQHTITPRLTVDYGVLDNLSLGFALPVVGKYDNVDDVTEFDIGDVSMRLRWQPFAALPGQARWTLLGEVTAPTGSSPFETELGEELATGDGYYSASLGVNVSKVIDPVVAFGSFSLIQGFKEDGLDQVRQTLDGQPLILTEVDPGLQAQLGLGVAFALSYDVSMTFQYQLGYAQETDLKFANGLSASSLDQTIGVFNLTTGFRLSPDRVLNVSVGFGNTEASPDVFLGVSLPFTVEKLSQLI
ncbi:MAG: hypothetical protein SVO96_03150 [Pseudomonadota bacterium]|jgi:hypothetical protein|nr:hypothetical protein [Pseudomonadota bacterium]